MEAGSHEGDTHAVVDEVEARVGGALDRWPSAPARWPVGALGPAVQSAAAASASAAARPRLRSVLGAALSVRRPGRSRPAARRGSPSARRHSGVASSNGTASRSTPPASTTRRSRRENRIFGEQRGPGRATRALAIVHIAMFDAMNAVVGGYRGYSPASPPGAPAPPPTPPSRRRLTTRWSRCSPSQAPTFDAALAADLAAIGPRRQGGGHRSRSPRRGRHPGATRQ